MRAVKATVALTLLAFGHCLSARTPSAGDAYEIRSSREMAQQGNDGSSGSSTDRDSMVARVIAVRDGGVELEYDLPKSATKEDRARNWQFPALVFKPAMGPMQLLNRPEMDVRVDRWLKAGKMTREACGHRIFTWNAFRIECDPQSVISTLEKLEAWPDDLREGAPYQDPGATGPSLLARNQASFVAEMEVDAEKARREHAEADVVVAEIMRKSLTLEAALRARSAEQISGKIVVTFDMDSSGETRRLTKVTKLETKGPGERVETQTVTETIEKRLILHAK